VVPERIIRDILHMAPPAAALQITTQRRLRPRPHLDARAVRRRGHADVVHIYILNNIILARILSQRPDTDSVGPRTVQTLHHDVGAVRLKRDAVVAVVDDAVLDRDGRGAVRVPAVRVLCRIGVVCAAGDGDVVVDDVGGVYDDVEPLRGESHVDVADAAAGQADDAEQDRAQDVDVLGVPVVPDLAVAIECAAPVDVDVLAANLPECGGVLEGKVEGVGVPVVGVV
jgi:hypothetical protein